MIQLISANTFKNSNGMIIDSAKENDKIIIFATAKEDIPVGLISKLIDKSKSNIEINFSLYISKEEIPLKVGMIISNYAHESFALDKNLLVLPGSTMQELNIKTIGDIKNSIRTKRKNKTEGNLDNINVSENIDINNPEKSQNIEKSSAKEKIASQNNKAFSPYEIDKVLKKTNISVKDMPENCNNYNDGDLAIAVLNICAVENIENIESKFIELFGKKNSKYQDVKIWIV